MADSSDTTRRSILDAAIGVFLRYGFKKTSMDEVARAARLSRQGLYLHFATKEALFKAAVSKLFETKRGALHDALARRDLGIEDHLLCVFEAFHGQDESAEHMAELIDTVNELMGVELKGTDEAFLAEVTRLLRASVAANWKDAGVSAKDLAQHLVTTSFGVKRSGPSRDDYRARMRIALRIVCRGGNLK